MTGELVLEALKPEKVPDVATPHPDNFREVMQLSLADAVEISKSINGIDVHKIGTTIFIARTKPNGFSSKWADVRNSQMFWLFFYDNIVMLIKLNVLEFDQRTPDIISNQACQQRLTS